jgi:hypothetical protein
VTLDKQIINLQEGCLTLSTIFQLYRGNQFNGGGNWHGPDFKEMGVWACIRFAIISYTANVNIYAK